MSVLGLYFIRLSLLRDVQFLSGLDIESEFGGGCCFVRLIKSDEMRFFLFILTIHIDIYIVCQN